MEEGVVVSEFEKNSREIVRVQLTTYRGIKLLDVRAFYEKDGERLPGKGIAIKRELIGELREALEKADRICCDTEA